MYDIIIIGGGPAGMTAALYALRNNKTVLIIEKSGFGGQIAYSPKVENYPGSLSMSGNEFADRLLNQIMAYGVELESETVTGIKDEGNIKRVLTEDGAKFEGRAVIIATGVKHRMLGLEGEDELVGKGISFCALCDGDFYSGEIVAVAGGGNSALQEASLLAENCKKVIIIQNLDHFTGETALSEKLLGRSNVKALMGTVIDELIIDDGQFKGLMLRKEASDQVFRLDCDGLFVAIGLVPENVAFKNLVELDDFGYAYSDESCLTKTPGVFVAGDCRSKSVRQITTAVADGSVAALAACRFIDSK